MDSQPDPSAWPPAPSGQSGAPKAKPGKAATKGLARYFLRLQLWQHLGIFVGLLGMALFWYLKTYHNVYTSTLYFCCPYGPPYYLWREFLWALTFLRLGQLLCLVQILVGGLTQRRWSAITEVIGFLILCLFWKAHVGRANQIIDILKLFNWVLRGLPCVPF